MRRSGPGCVLLVVIALCGSWGAQPAEAITIEFAATEINPALDLWQYDYRVSGFDFLTDQGFSILFNPSDYADLADPSVAAPADADWSLFALVPDPNLPADGSFEALALADQASLAELFTVTFVWLGAGSPGSQPFDVNQFDANGNFLGTITSGNTVPFAAVPEPGLLTLMMVGFAGLARVRRFIKRTQQV